MKTAVSPRTIVVAFLGTLAALHAQNLDLRTEMPMAVQSDAIAWEEGDSRRFQPALPTFDELPSAERVPSNIESPTSLMSQNELLSANRVGRSTTETILDLDLLRKPSPFRKVLVGIKRKPYEMSTDSLETGLAEISAAYREEGATKDAVDCEEIALSVAQQIKLDPSKLLEIVERETAANPDCACETVKAAIKTSEADVDDVVAIVETAILAAPDKMRIVSQCAIATMPEAISAVQALLSRLDPNAGDSGYSSKSAKDAKDSKVASITAPPALPNPLDLPPEGPPLMPPPIIPPVVTAVDPNGNVSYRIYR